MANVGKTVEIGCELWYAVITNDALVVRMKIAIQDIAQEELGHKGDIHLLITTQIR